MKADIHTNGGRNLTAMTLWSWERVYHAPSDQVREPSAIPVVDQLASECIESLFDVFERRFTQRPLAHVSPVSGDFVSGEPWASLLRRNTPGALPAHLQARCRRIFPCSWRRGRTTNSCGRP